MDVFLLDVIYRNHTEKNIYLDTNNEQLVRRWITRQSFDSKELRILILIRVDL